MLEVSCLYVCTINCLATITGQLLSYAMVAFAGKSWARCLPALASLYYSVHIVCVAVPLLMLLVPVLPTAPRTEKKSESKKTE